MPVRTSYPADSDIESFIAGCGITVPSGFDFVGSAQAAIDEFEDRTGRKPFLIDSNDVVLTYDAPGKTAQSRTFWPISGGGRILNLGLGILSVTSITVNGVTKTANVDYRLRPYNAGANEEPYSMIEFTVPIWGPAGAVVITCKRGFATTLTEDVWKGVRALAGAILARDLLQGILWSPSTVKEGDETTIQDDSRDIGKGWEIQASAVIERKKLRTVGIF